MPIVRKQKPKTIPQDRTGHRFHSLVVLGFYSNDGGLIKWLCRCDCGNHTVHGSGNLTSGQARRCADCRRVVLSKQASNRRTGISGTAAYAMWKRRRDSFCRRWKNDASVFNAECYAKRNGKYLQAINSKKKIGPDNFHWTNAPARDRGVIVDGKRVSTHEAMKILGG